MTLTFRSSIPEQFQIRGVDTNGRERIAKATRNAGDFNWEMQLIHPSGRNWQAKYHGEHILDALGELLTSKNTEYVQERNRGYRPEPEAFDYNRRLPDDDVIPPIVPINNRR